MNRGTCMEFWAGGREYSYVKSQTGDKSQTGGVTTKPTDRLTRKTNIEQINVNKLCGVRNQGEISHSLPVC